MQILEPREDFEDARIALPSHTRFIQFMDDARTPPFYFSFTSSRQLGRLSFHPPCLSSRGFVSDLRSAYVLVGVQIRLFSKQLGVQQRVPSVYQCQLSAKSDSSSDKRRPYETTSHISNVAGLWCIKK